MDRMMAGGCGVVVRRVGSPLVTPAVAAAVVLGESGNLAYKSTAGLKSNLLNTPAWRAGIELRRPAVREGEEPLSRVAAGVLMEEEGRTKPCATAARHTTAVAAVAMPHPAARLLLPC
jgi:hypothetical protein